VTTMVRCFKVLISFPDDVDQERILVRDVCADISRAKREQGIEIIPQDWKDDINHTISGKDGQEIIDRDLFARDDYHIYIGIMWKRYGQSRQDGQSPTAHEFALANKRREGTGEPVIKFFFKAPDAPSGNAEEARQMAAVHEFKEKMAPLGLYDTFDTRDEFRRKVHDNLCDIVERYDELTRKVLPDGDSERESSLRARRGGAPSGDSMGVDIGGKKMGASLATRPWRVPLPLFDDTTGHVRRSVVKVSEKSDNQWLGLLGAKSEDLLSALDAQPHIVMLGTSGEGKTNELDTLEKRLLDDECRIARLDLGQTCDEALDGQPFSLPTSRLRVLLIDGFDQLLQRDVCSRVRQIEAFAREHETIRMVVASRSNFVNLGNATGSTGMFRGFEAHELLDLDHAAIMAYLEYCLADRSGDFLECLPRQVGDLLVNPFYLYYLVNRFQEAGTIPQNQAVVFHELLEERWRTDTEHFRTSFMDLADDRKLADALLARLAVAMESLGRNWISHDEYLDLVPEHGDRTLLQHCGVWEKRIGRDSERWQFQQNGFQEYLAAWRMEELPLNAIKDLVAFGPDHKEIIPSWANVVGFMLDNTARQEVFDWVLSVDPTIAVKADPSRIPLKKRMAIFRGIYEDAKTKKIWIDRGKYPMRDLARFADRRENVRFLLAEAENPTSKAELGNSIYLLRFMRLPYSEEERAQTLLLKVVLDDQEDETIRALALFALSNQKLDDPPIVEQVVKGLRGSKSDWLRYSLYSFIHNGAQLDEYVDVFIEGIPFIRSRVGERGESRLMNEGTELNEGINKVRSPAAIKKVFAYFAENPSDLDEIRVKAEEDGWFANAANAYGADETLYLDAMKCFAALMSRYIEKGAAMLVTFFEKTGTRLRAFEEVLATWKDAMTKEQALAMLAADDTLDLLVNQCKEDKVEKDMLHSVCNLLRNTGKPHVDRFQKRLVEEFGDEFELPPPRDPDQEQNKERQRSVDLLFDREAFLEHARNVVDSIGKDDIAYDDVSDLRYRHRHEHDHPHLVMEELTHLTIEKAIPKETILDAISRRNWEWFRISELHGLMSSGQSVQLTEQQAETIGAWCLSNITKVDFRTAITVDGKRTSYKWLSIYLWFFFRRLNLAYPKATLLDMVSFDYFEPEDCKGIEYLESHLNEREMRNRVLDNLADGIDADHVLKNHLNYCLRHEEQDGVPFARKIICDASMDDSPRRTALDLLVGLAPEELGSALVEVPDSFKWNVVNEMVKMTDFSCRDHLMGLAKEAEADEKDNAICYLVRMGDLVGLQLYVDRTRERGVLVKKPWILEKNPLASFEDVAALPLFLDLLELSYTIDEEDDVFGNTLYRVVQDALTALALPSDQNHTAVQTAVTEFIKTHPDLKDVNFLHAFLERIETQFCRHKTERLSVHNVIKKLQKAGI